MHIVRTDTAAGQNVCLVMFHLLLSRCVRKISAGDRLRSPCFNRYTGDVTSREILTRTEVAFLLITGEIFNISWPVLRELGRVQSSGLKFGIVRGRSSILLNKKIKKI